MSERGVEQKFKIPALVGQPVRTFDLNMAIQTFFLEIWQLGAILSTKKQKPLYESHDNCFVATSPKFATI
jgi:hypothetical protein